MSAEVTFIREGRPVRYRAVVVAHNWAKSQFEYFNEARQEWREVRNWNTKARLFIRFSQKDV